MYRRGQLESGKLKQGTLLFERRVGPLSRQRHGKGEGAPLPVRARDPYPAPVVFDDLACYGETETGALGSRRQRVVRPVELLENKVDMRGRYADAAIGDLDHDLLRLMTGRNTDRAITRGELYRVGKEIGHDLNKTIAVA